MCFGRHAAKIAQCEVALKYHLKRKHLCAEALNMAADETATYNDGGAIRHLYKNDRLAVYGDSIASSVLCRAWYLRGGDKRKLTIRTICMTLKSDTERQEHGISFAKVACAIRIWPNGDSLSPCTNASLSIMALLACPPT